MACTAAGAIDPAATASPNATDSTKAREATTASVTDAADKTGVAAKTDAAGATARTAGHPAAVITTAASDNAASDAKGSATLQNNASS